VRLTQLQRLLSACLCAALVLALATPAHATDAPTDASSLGQRIELPHTWLFTATDNPSNASPTLDDSAWTSISTVHPLTAYGFRNYRYAWYRAHIRLRPDVRNLAIETEYLQGRYEIFANGVRLGSFGNLADHSVTAQYKLLTFPIPDHILADANGSLILAIRFAVEPAGDDGPGTAAPMDARSSVVLASQSDIVSDIGFAFSREYGISLLIVGLNAIVGIVALALFVSIRTQREYLPLAVFLLQPTLSAFNIALAAHLGPSPWAVWVTYLLVGVGEVALLEFVRLVLSIPRNRWFTVFEYALLLTPLLGPLTYNGLFPQLLGFSLFFLPRLLLVFILPALLFRYWSSNRDARLLLPAVILTSINLYFEFFWWLGYLIHFTRRKPPALLIHMGSYRLSLTQVGDILFAVGMLFFIILRTVRISRSRATLTAEIAAAATVQQLLLARSSHPTPGFLVNSVYLPASNVGGDFFLVTTHPFDGSLIAVIGDVSGKGLTAAMRVAMILGVLRRETSHHPGDVLASLNDAIIAQGELGFTTALCVRVFLNGDFILANAGHIPPYIAATPSTPATISRDFPTPPALPLGLVLGEVYALQKGHLDPNEHLVLLSDGVPEARSHTGELYGFDRLANITTLPAQDIADAAQRFGQEDDITVLTLAVTS
jgi:hypothetical protein